MVYHTFIGRYVQPGVFQLFGSDLVVFTDSAGDCKKIVVCSGVEWWEPGELRAILTALTSPHLYHPIKSIPYPDKYLDTLYSQ